MQCCKMHTMLQDACNAARCIYTDTNNWSTAWVQHYEKEVVLHWLPSIPRTHKCHSSPDSPCSTFHWHHQNRVEISSSFYPKRQWKQEGILLKKLIICQDLMELLPINRVFPDAQMRVPGPQIAQKMQNRRTTEGWTGPLECSCFSRVVNCK